MKTRKGHSLEAIIMLSKGHMLIFLPHVLLKVYNIVLMNNFFPNFLQGGSHKWGLKAG